MLVTRQKYSNFFVYFILQVILNLSLSRTIEFLITPERRQIRAGNFTSCHQQFFAHHFLKKEDRNLLQNRASTNLPSFQRSWHHFSDGICVQCGLKLISRKKDFKHGAVYHEKPGKQNGYTVYLHLISTEEVKNWIIKANIREVVFFWKQACRYLTWLP